MLNKLEKIALQALVSTLPPDPLIVEVGSFVGGSVALMHRMRPDARFIVIDDWLSRGSAELADGTDDQWYDLRGRDPRELFDENTRGMNVEVHHMRVRNPGQLDGMFDGVECDLYFDDAGAIALPYFIDRIKPGGVACGHDYVSQEWIDDTNDDDERYKRTNSISIDRPVVDAVASQRSAEVNVVSTLWWFRRHW